MHWPTVVAIIGFSAILAFVISLFVSRASNRPVRWGGGSSPTDEPSVPSKPDAE